MGTVANWNAPVLSTGATMISAPELLDLRVFQEKPDFVCRSSSFLNINLNLQTKTKKPTVWQNTTCGCGSVTSKFRNVHSHKMVLSLGKEVGNVTCRSTGKTACRPDSFKTSSRGPPVIQSGSL